MKRRQFIQSLTAASALGVFTSRAAQAAASKSKVPVLPKVLDAGKWAPVSQQRLQAVIDELGSASRKYNPNKRPYAVFDWDNTSIMNDTEEALFMYQIIFSAESFASDPELPKKTLDIGAGARSISISARSIIGSCDFAVKAW